MKKIVIAGMLSIAMSLFADVNMNDKSVVDNIGLAGLKSKFSTIDKTKAGKWYLLKTDRKHYLKVRNDEFEIDDAISSSYTKFQTKVNKESFVGKTAVLRLGIKFSKYDFKKKLFPISAMTKDSYVSFDGGPIVTSDGLRISFDNINDSHSFLPMAKSDAKEFIKARKDSRGNVDKRLTLRYTYVIKSIESPVKPINTCEQRDRSCWQLDKIKLIGHITKLEILDKDNKVLHTYSDYK